MEVVEFYVFAAQHAILQLLAAEEILVVLQVVVLPCHPKRIVICGLYLLQSIAVGRQNRPCAPYLIGLEIGVAISAIM